MPILFRAFIGLNVLVSVFHYNINCTVHNHKMMTDCLHYTVYTRDAIKLVVKGIELEGEGVDGEKAVKGPMWKCSPGPPATLRRH